MRKITSFFIIIIILFNFIFCNKSFAFGGVDGLTPDLFSTDGLTNLILGGQSSDQDSTGKIRTNIASRNQLGEIILKAVVGLMFLSFNAFPMTIQSLLSRFAYDGESEIKRLTIEDMVFGRVDTLNIDFFNDNCNSQMIKTFRNSVYNWYVTMVEIAAAMSLLVLIYIGIRMALSVTSGDKARYKKMFTGWVESVILLFVLHYIIAFVLELCNIFNVAIDDMSKSGLATSFEIQIINKVYYILNSLNGWEYAINSIVFWIIVGIQTRFFLAYIKRMITVGFLILISPLVTIIYAIDKAGDGKAQSFSNWMSEFSANVMIQPIEGMLYLVFMTVAGEIANTSILVSALFLLAMTRVERTILHLFHVRGKSLNIVGDRGKKG